jgi:hypothetical protein
MMEDHAGVFVSSNVLLRCFLTSGFRSISKSFAISQLRESCDAWNFFSLDCIRRPIGM